MDACVRFKRARKALKLSLHQVAQSTGLSAMMVLQIESGKKLPLKGRSVQTLCSFYGIEYEVIITEFYNAKIAKLREELDRVLVISKRKSKKKRKPSKEVTHG